MIARGGLMGPRLLLKRLREAMAEPASAQARLDRIVRIIAANLVAEVCSVYVVRGSGDLELFATEGLNASAVHVTTMGAGEGLVGLVAREATPINLPEARSHPAFSYKPETGEEEYHSFLGVPMLRGGIVLGVLVVQNRTHRLYGDDEVEALQFTAMVLAELVASGELQSIAATDAPIANRRPLSVEGVCIADGVGLGHVVLHQPRVVVKNLVSDDPAAETARLDAALRAVQTSIDTLLENGPLGGDGEHRDVLETFRLFAHDRGWNRRMREAVQSGLSAEAAVQRVQSETRARLMRVDDPYLRERLYDLDELADRLLHELVGASFAPDGDVPENAIVVARTMGPAALLDFDRTRLRALVLEEGGPTSHIAIVARALGVPAVGQVKNISSLVEPGDAIIVDGATGTVQVRPLPDVERAYQDKARLRARRLERYRRIRDEPSVTRDGRAVELLMNAGLLIDLPHVAETGAAGIGLFRTELQFMVADRMPRGSDQLALYKRVLDAVGDRPVTFRTLDIGGDKILPYMEAEAEENPALGWRAIRIGLDRPALLRSQLKALLRAAAGRSLRVMFPMVATVAEFDEARAILDRERALLIRAGHVVPGEIKVGVMLEVPSLLFELEDLVGRVDFISVGSNDLFQFLFAADRDNPRVAHRFDPLSPAALRALLRISEAALAGDVEATVCGEIAGRPLEALALLALGFTKLSMTATAIGPVKAMTLGLDVAAARAEIDAQLAKPGTVSLRSALSAFADARDVPLA